MTRYIEDQDSDLDEYGNLPLKPYQPIIIWKVGDLIQSKYYKHIFRKIAEVRETGYSWYYPEWDFEAITPGGSENHWWSENSNDPFLEGWIKFVS